MLPFSSYVLRHYYRETGWNDDNLYANLTRSSTAILDFTIPKGLALCISKSPNALFSTTWSMTALPTLNGSIGYIFSSRELKLPNSGDVAFDDMVDKFKVYDPPRVPDISGQEWKGGRSVRDYLMYGRLYMFSGRLDALYTVRFTPALQGIVAGISDFPLKSPMTVPTNSYDSTSRSNVMLSLQHDTGRWCSEYTWSAEDAMFGIRVLRNFGKLVGDADEPRSSWRNEGRKRVDEEDAIEGGVRGRLSAGAELYFSALEKSAGVSTGIRFTTLPDIPNGAISSGSDSTCSQPPATLTAIFNPMMGHISSAYAAQVSQDLSLCSRFDFNVYSYESTWTFGSEWWMRKRLRNDSDLQEEVTAALDTESDPPTQSHYDDTQGVIKARMSTKMDFSLLWEGRIQNILVSLGLVSDLTSKSKPIKALGLEISYFSSD